MQRHLLSLLSLGSVALLASSCGSDAIGVGTKSVGQRCFATQDCASELVCSAERICVPSNNAPGGSTNQTPTTGGTANTGGTGDTGGTTGGSTTGGGSTGGNTTGGTGGTTGETSFTNTVVNQQCDQEGESICLGSGFGAICRDGRYQDTFACVGDARCEAGECRFEQNECPDMLKCVDDFTITTCSVSPTGDLLIGSMRCPPEFECFQGRCDNSPERDRDGDGFPRSRDCDDRDPDINPGRPEICGNGVDDNCNMRVDLEDDECRIEQRCVRQGDRCRGEMDSNGFYQCVDINNDGTFFCNGLCNPSRDGQGGLPTNCPDNPNAHRCVPVEQNPNVGLCFAKCTTPGSNGSCTAPASCVALGPSGYGGEVVETSQGVCIDSGTAKLGDRCGTQGGFCGEGGICANGVCTKACRPFSINGANSADCSGRTQCNPVTYTLGICQLSIRPAQCNAARVGQMCGANGLMCLPDLNGLNVRCRQICRLSSQFELSDCGGSSCVKHPRLSDRQDVGICS